MKIYRPAMNALMDAKDAIADKLSAGTSVKDTSAAGDDGCLGNAKEAVSDKVHSAAEAVKDALPEGTVSEDVAQDTVGGTGLAAHVDDVIGESNTAAEEGAGGLMGQAAELVGGEDKTPEEGTGGLMAAVPKVHDKPPAKKTGGLF